MKYRPDLDVTITRLLPTLAMLTTVADFRRFGAALLGRPREDFYACLGTPTSVAGDVLTYRVTQRKSIELTFNRFGECFWARFHGCKEVADWVMAEGYRLGDDGQKHCILSRHLQDMAPPDDLDWENCTEIPLVVSWELRDDDADYTWTPTKLFSREPRQKDTK